MLAMLCRLWHSSFDMAVPYQIYRSADAFFANADRFNAAVSKSPDVLDFCCSSYWTQAAHRSLHRDDRSGAPFLAAHDAGAENWIVFAKGASWFWEPLENAWAFSCPLIGADSEAVVDLLESVCVGELGGASAFLIGGVAQGGSLQRVLNERQQSYRRLVEFEGMTSMSIDLTDGVDGYLARRSVKFRKSLRQSQRRVDDAGVVIEEAQGTWPEMFERILRIQQRTTKWLRGDDIFHHEGYLDFYGSLAESALGDGLLRLLFARQGDEDVAFILGADFRGTYRGLQMSYAAGHADLGIGNVLQFENLKRCAQAGITGYDLGMFAPYKERWTDVQVQFRNLLLIL